MCEKDRIKNHVTQGDVARFLAMDMEPDELIAFAEHIEACPACAAMLAEVEEDTNLHVPAGFAPEVRRRVAGGDKKEFYRYSVRVCAAVCAALMLIFTGSFNFEEVREIQAPKLEFLDKMTQSISEFSNTLIKWEGINNGQKK